MAQPCELQAVAFPCENRIEDRQATEACDVAQHMVHLYIHLVKRLLDVQYVFGSHLEQALTMTPQCADGAYLIRRPKAALQKPDRVQVLDPLTVRNVALSPRNAF